MAFILLFTLPALFAAETPVEPKTLSPDAELPDRQVDVDLGERVYNLNEEIGNAKEVIAFYQKEVGLLDDPVQQARIEGIAHKVITAAWQVGPEQVRVDAPADEKSPAELTFTFRILDSDEINAFSAWGGNIYITRGMLEFCQSDDELAGILAHETAHSLYHHLQDQVSQVKKFNTQQILALIAAAFMGVNVAHVAGIVQWVHLALLNGHSVEAEKQADWAGCYYAYRAGYNPVGMITCFERLHRLHMSRPHYDDLGAFQTHPWSDDRAEGLEQQIRDLGLPIDRRAVTNAITAGVRATPREEGPPKVELLLGDTLLLEMSGADRSAEDRAADAALAINRALNRGMKSRDLRLIENEPADGWMIRTITKLKPEDLFEVRPADAALVGKPTEQFANQVYQRFVARCRQEEINRGAL